MSDLNEMHPSKWNRDFFGNIVTIKDDAGAPVQTMQVSGESKTVTEVSEIIQAAEKSTILVMLLDKDVAIAAGASLGNVQIPLPAEFNGKNIIDCKVYISPLGTASSSGAITFNLVRTRSGSAVDVLSSVLSIAQSGTASGVASINTANDDLLSDDYISLDCEDDGTGAKGPLWLKVVAQ